MRWILVACFAFSLWLVGCPEPFNIENPPCESNADCSVEQLGADFADHVCVDQRCYARADAPTPQGGGADAGTPAGLYDAGQAPDTGPNTDECGLERPCPEGQDCLDGVCRASAGRCETDDNCPNNEVCREGACFAPCQAHDNCPPTEVCLQQICVDRPTCGASAVQDDAGPADSGSSPLDAGPACPGDLRCSNGRCVRPDCVEDSDCPGEAGEQSCVEGRCVPS